MSTLTTSILAASILATSLGFAALPTGGAEHEAANATAKDQSRLSDRIEEAFAAAELVAFDGAVATRVAAAARKTDRLPAATDCKGQAWPYIARSCLAGADEANRAPAVRTVTVEYRVGDSASVLVRLPATQLAGR